MSDKHKILLESIKNATSESCLRGLLQGLEGHVREERLLQWLNLIHRATIQILEEKNEKVQTGKS